MTRFRIACLHTADSNAALFDAAAVSLPIQLTHCVRPDLLVAAQQSLDTALDQTTEVLKDLCTDADAVILTCSTLGPAADTLAANWPVLRADRSLARKSLQGGAAVAVLCTAPSTVTATTNLFSEVAREYGGRFTVEIVPGAWDAFQSGDLDTYNSLIASAADHTFESGFERVAFAQVSMTPAAGRCAKASPLVIPPLALEAAVAVACGSDC